MSNYFIHPLADGYGPIIYSDQTAYVNTSWLTAHNAFVNIQDGWGWLPQQRLHIKEQFNQGVHSFMVDIHKNAEDKLILQHGKNFSKYGVEQPILSGITYSSTKVSYLADFLGDIIDVLQNDSSAIITLHIESYVKSTELRSALDKARLGSYLLETNPNDPNLTLGEMRETNSRLVIFSDYSAYHQDREFALNDKDNALQKGIHYINLHKETEYDLGKFPNCEMRAEGRAKAKNTLVNLLVFNHFYPESCAHGYYNIYWNYVYGAVQNDCNSVNAYEVIMNRIKLCLANGLFPNFIAVDFIEQGACGGVSTATYFDPSGRHPF
jgi:hypothetical protein